MIKVFISATIVILLASCGEDSQERKDGYSDNAKNPEDSLFQEVMDGHDEAMAKMGKIAGYRKQIDRKMDSLKKIKSSAKVRIEKRLQELGAELKDAEEQMNTWMEEFSIDSAQDNIERRLAYLKSEKSKVEKVKAKIFSTIDKADSTLNGVSRSEKQKAKE